MEVAPLRYLTEHQLEIKKNYKFFKLPIDQRGLNIMLLIHFFVAQDDQTYGIFNYLRQWVVTWWTQASTWTNIYLSRRSYLIQLKAIPPQMPKILVFTMNLKSTCLK